jgi:hypothetical protein
MDTSNHSMEALFAQLGLPNSEIAIDNFSQAQFIRESIAQDTDWANVVDNLDAQLRH